MIIRLVLGIVAVILLAVASFTWGRNGPSLPVIVGLLVAAVALAAVAAG